MIAINVHLFVMLEKKVCNSGRPLSTPWRHGQNKVRLHCWDIHDSSRFAFAMPVLFTRQTISTWVCRRQCVKDQVKKYKKCLVVAGNIIVSIIIRTSTNILSELFAYIIILRFFFLIHLNPTVLQQRFQSFVIALCLPLCYTEMMLRQFVWGQLVKEGTVTNLSQTVIWWA